MDARRPGLRTPFVTLLGLLLAMLSSPAAAAALRVPAATRQLVVVVTADAAATRGVLTRWERHGRTWASVGEPIDVHVGERGLIAAADKREGDCRAPAGLFRLREVTYYADAPRPTTAMATRAATPHTYCIDEPAAPDYNRFRDVKTGARAAGEIMRRQDDLYAITVVVEHNRAPVVPGHGSCIFIHADNGAPTLGCTTMPGPALRALVAWLAPKSQPMLLQLTRADYERVAPAANLPANLAANLPAAP